MSKRVYGIDLGTTYSCISYVDEHGKPVVVPNAEGELTTPSVVWFESPESVVVGRTAKDHAIIQRDRVVSTIKPEMGDATSERFIDGKTYRPQEISAHILRKLAKDATTITGDVIEDVVITCPVYFGVTQKEATQQAGAIAGLNVLYVIPEPTAAAVAYGIEATDNQNILVYDLGGGTFDVTLISISAGEIAVIATGGDDRLGGKEWDEKIASSCASIKGGFSAV
jgi:molecular chaperone DnaK